MRTSKTASVGLARQSRLPGQELSTSMAERALITESSVDCPVHDVGNWPCKQRALRRAQGQRIGLLFSGWQKLGDVEAAVRVNSIFGMKILS